MAQAARYGVALAGATLYCTNTPCLLCARLIMSSGIREVVFEETYGDHRAVLAFLREAGVRSRRFRRATAGPNRTRNRRARA